MTAIVTDVHYRMSLSIIRDLSCAGVKVITCEKAEYSSGNMPLGFFSKHSSGSHVLSDENYAEELYALCAEVSDANGEKPVLITVGADTLARVSAEKERFCSVAGVLTPRKETLDNFNNKVYAAKLAMECGVPVPETYSAENAHFPCVVKPAFGEKLGLSAHERYKIVCTAEELSNAAAHFKKITGEAPIIQKYLTGGALGCSVVAQDGKILNHLCHRRIREYPVSGGPSSCCIAIKGSELLPHVEKMVAASGFSGASMFEFKEDADGIAHLLEINPRVWGSYPLSRAAKSGISVSWFDAAFEAANGKKTNLEARSPKIGKKMNFALSDAMAAIGYIRKGRVLKGLGAFADILNPAVKDGVFEWGDFLPGIKYLFSLGSKR